jgi:uridine kinase
MPIYDISADGCVRHRPVTTDGSPLVVAEGIFADQIAVALRERDLPAVAICVRHHRLVSFVRRLQRDIREQRKPAWVLVRRGLLLFRDEPRVVRRCLDAGCEPLTPATARRRIAELLVVARQRADGAHDTSTLVHRGLIRFPFIFN